MNPTPPASPRSWGLFRPPQFDAWSTTTPDRFSAQAEAYVLRVRAFYDSRARWHRRFYRLSGIIVIVLGGALPLIAASEWSNSDLLVSVTGFTVATVTALRGFYRWDSSWVLLRATELAITRRYLRWKAEQDGSGAAGADRERAAALLWDMLSLRENESKNFFKDLPLAEQLVSTGAAPPGGPPPDTGDAPGRTGRPLSG